ncbi:MAG: cache domain-containing protein [Candidatus Omnitrophota bacterium]
MRNIIRKIWFYPVLAIVLAVVCYQAWLNHADFKRTMVREAQAQLLIIAKSEAQSIEKYIGNINQELEILSSEFAVHQMLAGRYGRDEWKKYREYLEGSYKDVEELVDSLYLINAKGVIVDVDPAKEEMIGRDFSEAPALRRTLEEGRPYASSVFRLASGELAIADLYPVTEEGRSIGLLRADILVSRIDRLLEHLNQAEERRAFMIDNEKTLLSYRDRSYLGKSVRVIINDIPGEEERRRSEHIIERMLAGEEGTDMLYLSPGGKTAGVKRILIAFAPVNIGSHTWSIALMMDYRLISGPINRNALNNLIFSGSILLILVILGVSLYRVRKKQDESALSQAALNIINRQLHLEIDERRKIEEELHESLRRRRPD